MAEFIKRFLRRIGIVICMGLVGIVGTAYLGWIGVPIAIVFGVILAFAPER